MRRKPGPLRARQETALAVIRASLAERGHRPTAREIGAQVGRAAGLRSRGPGAASCGRPHAVRR
ncbi:LexA family protein [Streptomyces parvus]|uniref:LexA family protein n=1 Tax=Streptomyces parvus TaxID=66428 RepID=UPI003633C591